MKKFIAATTGALLMSAGLVASAGTAAHADPYPGTVATKTVVTAPAKVKTKKKARVQVCASTTVASGTGTPTGTLTLSVGKVGKAAKQTVTYNYGGGQVCLTTDPLRKGAYLATANFSSPAKSVYNDSSGATAFEVIKKKKRHRGR